MLVILFDGIAYGMVLFILACGLSITLGLMNVINLAHGVFAMAGGYVMAGMMNRWGVPFLATLPFAFIVPALLGLVLERTLYRRLYQRSHLDQVLFTIGLTFMASAGFDYLFGSQQQLIQLPAFLQGRVDVGGVQIGRYRSLIIVICAVVVICLQMVLSNTRFGARLRAAVDDQRVARGLGINTSAVFAVTFAVGSGLAGLGGALGTEILGMDPTFPLKFLIYFMIVVTVGGTTSLTGPFLAALLLGIADVAGKYYMPSVGAFVIYTVMIVVLVVRPQGLFTRAR